MDVAPKDDVVFLRNLVRRLNPEAKVLETVQSKVNCKDIINTNLFDFEKAAMAPGWLKEMRGTHVPETEEYGIASFIYRARVPFHPQRIHAFLDTHFLFVVRQPGDDEEDDDEGDDKGEDEGDAEGEDEMEGTVEDANAGLDKKRDEVLAKSRPKFGNIVRSKGYFWMAHEYDYSYEWSQAGVMLTASLGDPWFASMDEDEWPEEAREQILSDFDPTGPHGDRRQELVIIGSEMNKDALTAALDACLLTKEEQAMGVEKWADAFEHEWPTWSAPPDDDHAHGDAGAPDQDDSDGPAQPKRARTGSA
eukprot:m.20557 g.20557  ORF g.20557 m.20557 type:complete len:306 (+) comp12165_c0_seq1:2-919(+)